VTVQPQPEGETVNMKNKVAIVTGGAQAPASGSAAGVTLGRG
jgi:hypothetical protein